MNGVQCYELFGGIALKNHTFSFLVGDMNIHFDNPQQSLTKQTLIIIIIIMVIYK